MEENLDKSTQQEQVVQEKQSKKVSEKLKKYYIRVACVSFSITIVIGAIIGAIIFALGGGIGNADSIYQRGISYYEKGKYEKSEQIFLKALSKDENHIDSMKGLCNAYEALGKYAQMTELAIKGLSVAPGEFDFYSSAVKGYSYQGQMAKAREILTKCDNNYVLMKIENGNPGSVKFSQNSGVYGQQFELKITTDKGAAIYYTTDGSEPNLNSTLYKDPIKVTDMLNIRAFAMSSSGIISDEVMGKFRVRDENAEYIFKDKIVEEMVRANLGIYGTLTYKDLDSIKTLTSEGSSGKISNLDDFDEFINLTSVTIKGDEIKDYKTLATLEKLKTLKFINMDITTEQLKQIAACKNVTEITFNNCGLTNVSALESLTQLTTLNVDDNKIDPQSFSSLSSLKITTLSVKGNALKELGGIGEITTLKILNISSNDITTLNGISRLTKLDTLTATDNEISSTPGMSFLTLLKNVDISNNKLTDATELAKAKTINSLNVSGNKIKDFSAFRNTKILTLIAKNCSISDLSDICQISTIRSLDVSNNSISDLSPIKDLPHINDLKVANNNVTTILSLRGSTTLMTLDISGNDVDKAQAAQLPSIKISWG